MKMKRERRRGGEEKGEGRRKGEKEEEMRYKKACLLIWERRERSKK